MLKTGLMVDDPLFTMWVSVCHVVDVQCYGKCCKHTSSAPRSDSLAGRCCG